MDVAMETMGTSVDRDALDDSSGTFLTSPPPAWVSSTQPVMSIHLNLVRQYYNGRFFFLYSNLLQDKKSSMPNSMLTTVIQWAHNRMFVYLFNY